VRLLHFEKENIHMNEAVSQGGELLVGIFTACIVVGSIMLLLSNTDAGILRMYAAYFLEAAC